MPEMRKICVCFCLCDVCVKVVIYYWLFENTGAQKCTAKYECDGANWGLRLQVEQPGEGSGGFQLEERNSFMMFFSYNN